MRPYDISSVESIVEHARKLIGMSLSEAVDLPPEVSNSNAKGRLGELLEEYWFEIFPSNLSNLPDFPEAGLELKTTGVRKAKKQEFLAKDRLVLTVINPTKIQNEDWETSSFLNKCRLILLMFYLYEKEKREIDRTFVIEPKLLNLMNLNEHELSQIIKDWQFIRDKCAENKAHELSEGDTTYLKACRKGPGGENEPLRAQSDGAPPAKNRAFSFPASFISRQIFKSGGSETTLVGAAPQTVEEAAKKQLTAWVGKDVKDIALQTRFSSRSKSKNYQLVKHLLTGTSKLPAEFIQAGIVLRTITLNKSGVPTENMSFDAFDPVELVQESWEESGLAQDLEQRYLLVVFEKVDKEKTLLKTAGFWTMPFEDRVSAEEVWKQTRQSISIGDYNNLPKIAEHHAIFVNTHGANRKDLIRTPKGDLMTKRSFWISRHYLANQISKNLTW